MTARNTPDSRPQGEPAPSGNFLAELRGGEAGETQILGGAAPRNKVSLQTLVVVGVIVASAGMLYAMRRYGMGAGMRFETIKIDYNWDKASPLTAAQQRRVLDELARSGTPIQPPVDHLPKNPFVLDVAPGPVARASGPTPELLAEIQRQMREKEVLSALSALQLNSVMEGRVPLARIDGRLYRIGDRVANLFTVAAIHGRSAELEADGKTYSISLVEPEIKDSGRP
jgi:hypothetical protein